MFQQRGRENALQFVEDETPEQAMVGGEPEQTIVEQDILDVETEVSMAFS